MTVAIEKVDERKSFSGMSASSFMSVSTMTKRDDAEPPIT